MELHFHAHHADVSDTMRRRAEREVLRVVRRVPRAVEGVIRFEQDGPTRRVSLVLRTPRKPDLVGRAEGRYFAPALATAIAKVMAQVSRERRATGKARARRAARARN